MSLDDLVALMRIEVSPLELVVRGTAMYWFLFLLFRFVLRRDTGSIAVADGFVLVATLVGWNWLMDWASFRWNAVRRFVEPPPVVLVRRGRLIARNLRQELITIPELMANLRTHGIDKLADVKMARMEPDGNISVIREQQGGGDDGDQPSRRPPLG